MNMVEHDWITIPWTKTKSMLKPKVVGDVDFLLMSPYGVFVA